MIVIQRLDPGQLLNSKIVRMMTTMMTEVSPTKKAMTRNWTKKTSRTQTMLM
jgi:hypothetical protein